MNRCSCKRSACGFARNPCSASPSILRLKYYPRDAPANTLVVVKGLANEDFLIEIDGIAVI